MTIIPSCRFKEGPMISFRSVPNRLNGTWEVVEFKSNDVDSLKYYNGTLVRRMHTHYLKIIYNFC